EGRDPSFSSVMVAEWIPAFAGMTRKMPLAGVGPWSLSPCHARQDEDLAAFRDRPEPVVAVDLAVDRHRYAAVDQRLQLRVVLAEAGQQLVDVGGLDRKAGPAAGCRLERPRQLDLDHGAL